MLRIFLPLILLAIVTGCNTLRNSPKYQFGDDLYKYGHKGAPYQKVFVYTEGDSISIFSATEQKKQLFPDTLKDQFFLKQSFDVDVMTVPFKYHPGNSSLPRQLTTDFNGNAFIGYRLHRFRVRIT